jgi:hypothetical protein
MHINMYTHTHTHTHTHAHIHTHTHTHIMRERVLFIGTQFSNLYTAVDTPASI